MPQLDIMTFYTQGFSVLVSVFFSFHVFYFYFLPSLSSTLFCRSILKQTFIVDFRVLEDITRKLIFRIIKIHTPLMIGINKKLIKSLITSCEVIRQTKTITFEEYVKENESKFNVLIHKNLV